MKTGRTPSRWFRSLLDVRPGERGPVAFLFAYGFLVLASFYILKPLRNSVFVERVGAEDLPVVYILTAVGVTLAMFLYQRVSRRARGSTMVVATLVALAASLLGFRWWLGRGGGTWSAGAFYVWGKLFPLLLVSQFYLTANVIFTTRQARRLFALIGLGLVSGGVAGSAVAGVTASALGTPNLLLVAAALLLLCSLPVLALRDRLAGGDAQEGPMERVSGEAWRLIRDSSHLRLIALILGLTTVVGTLVDWQFNSAVDAFIPGEDAKTGFYGRFFLFVNVGSVGIQALLTGFVLRKLGIGAAMLILPVGLLGSSVAIAAVPLLVTAALAKGMEGALRYSLDQSTRELLFLPVPTEMKLRTKPLIDLVVFRGGTGLGGLLLLAILHGPDLDWEGSMRAAAALSGVLAVGWALVTFRMRHEFRASLRRLIGVQDIELDELVVQRLDSRTLEEVRAALGSPKEGEVRFALGLLERYPSPAAADDLAALLDHPSDDVRRRALALLSELEAEGHAERVRERLEDDALEVRVEAIRYLCYHADRDPDTQMREFLEAEDVRVRIAATACILQHGGAAQADVAEQAIADLAGSEDVESRLRAAELLGTLRRLGERGARMLDRLLEDREREVRDASMLAAGQVRRREALPRLIARLGVPGERRGAHEGLRAYGSAGHGPLLEALRDGGRPLSVLLAIPPLFVGEEAGQETVEALLEILPDAPPPVRFEILRTLNKLRRERPDLDFRRYDLDPLVEREVGEAYAWVAFRDDLGTTRTDGGPEAAPDEGTTRGDSLLHRTLRQRTLEAAERASRLLGLRYPLEDLYAAFTALESAHATRMDQGFELLDSTLPRRYRDLVDPLLNPDRSVAETAEEARRRYELSRRRPPEALRELAEGDDPWVAVLASRVAGLPIDDRLSPSTVAVARQVRARAADVAGDADSPPTEETPLMDIVERAELLQETDLFGNLRSEDLGGIAALASERTFDAEATVFEEGGTGCELYIVVEGRIAARRGDVELFVAERGETVGDLSLLDGEPREYRAVTLEPSRVLVLRREDFYNFLEERFRMVRGVLAHLAGMLRRLNERADGSARPGAEGSANRDAEGREGGP